MTSTIDTLGNKWKKETILLFSETMHVPRNRRWHKSQKRQTLRNYMAAQCLWRMPLVSEAAVFTPFSNLVCTLSLCFSWSVSWICFVFLTFLPCSSLVLPVSPNPQVCRLYQGDVEADPGADVSRSLTVLHLVHTHLSEQIYSPPVHCRWVKKQSRCQGDIAHTDSAAGELWYDPQPKWTEWADRFAKGRPIHSHMCFLYFNFNYIYPSM